MHADLGELTTAKSAACEPPGDHTRVAGLVEERPVRSSFIIEGIADQAGELLARELSAIGDLEVFRCAFFT